MGLIIHVGDVEIATAQVLLDHGLPERLHAAWHALVALDANDEHTLMTLLRNQRREIQTQILIAQATAAENIGRRCAGCAQIFPQRELTPSPYHSHDLRCAPCLEDLDKKMQREMTKRNLRSALQRVAPGVKSTLTEPQWLRTLATFDNRCAYCKVMYWRVIDFAMPLQLGGAVAHDNAIPACYGCRARKGIRTLDELIANPSGWDAAQLAKIDEWIWENSPRRTRGPGAVQAVPPPSPPKRKRKRT